MQNPNAAPPRRRAAAPGCLFLMWLTVVLLDRLTVFLTSLSKKWGKDLAVCLFFYYFCMHETCSDFHQYIWIINTLRAYRGLTLEELNQKWIVFVRSEINIMIIFVANCGLCGSTRFISEIGKNCLSAKHFSIILQFFLQIAITFPTFSYLCNQVLLIVVNYTRFGKFPGCRVAV